MHPANSDDAFVIAMKTDKGFSTVGNHNLSTQTGPSHPDNSNGVRALDSPLADLPVSHQSQ